MVDHKIMLMNLNYIELMSLHFVLMVNILDHNFLHMVYFRDLYWALYCFVNDVPLHVTNSNLDIFADEYTVDKYFFLVDGRS